MGMKSWISFVFQVFVNKRKAFKVEVVDANEVADIEKSKAPKPKKTGMVR